MISMENLTIWREFMTFDIKQYIRNGGNVTIFQGKMHFFQTLVTSNILMGGGGETPLKMKIINHDNLLYEVPTI